MIFPLTYWDAIKKNAALYELDPYVIASLILQESNFDPSAHSGANAWGLMQIVPATGRRLATAVGIRRFNTAMLTNGDTNIRLGTLYFKRLLSQFGGVYYALASYNAGENRVVRWKAERPGMDEDVFIDDIPFPETQNYVKRVLGIAEDYRRLYGEGDGHASPVVKKAARRRHEEERPRKRRRRRRRRALGRRSRGEEGGAGLTCNAGRLAARTAASSRTDPNPPALRPDLTPRRRSHSAPTSSRIPHDFVDGHPIVAGQRVEIRQIALQALPDLVLPIHIHVPVHGDVPHAVPREDGERVRRRERSSTGAASRKSAGMTSL